MQGWALCVCVQTGFTQHGFHLVAVACMCRDAGIGSVSVGSCCTLWLRPPPPHRVYALETSKIRRKCEICSVPGARAPTTYPPGTEALGPPPSPSLLVFRANPPPFGTAIQPYAPPQPSPATKALGLPPCPPGYPPTPQGILQKTSFFFFLYALETSKIRRKLLCPWGL